MLPTTNSGGKQFGMRDGDQSISNMEIFTGNVFEVHVGPLPVVEFTLRKNLACHACPFIEEALNGESVEATTKVVPLPKDDPKIFNEFVSYIYYERIFIDTNAN